MPNSNYLDIFNQALNKRLPERPQETTSEGSEGVSMPLKECPEPIEGKEVDGPASRCLGLDCEYVSYKDREGRQVLWCSKENEKVYDIEDCPFENWFKDKNGWPIKKGSKP